MFSTPHSALIYTWTTSSRAVSLVLPHDCNVCKLPIRGLGLPNIRGTGLDRAVSLPDRLYFGLRGSVLGFSYSRKDKSSTNCKSRVILVLGQVFFVQLLFLWDSFVVFKASL